jgi:hypothetical protein
MRAAAKIAVAVSAVVIAGLVALAAPTIASGIGAASASRPHAGDTTVDSRTTAPTPSAPGTADGASSCVETAVDRGARTGAMGTARVDSHGTAIGYTVAAGDAPMAIGARFCVDYVSILHLNGYWVGGDGKDIAPGDYLYLYPDPAVVQSSHPTHTAPPA